MLIKVPANYDPVTRDYTGVWDGTFTTAWSDNPAWVLYDLITSRRYGLGENVNELEADKYAHLPDRAILRRACGRRVGRDRTAVYV